jgi:hypothetical protein
MTVAVLALVMAGCDASATGSGPTGGTSSVTATATPRTTTTGSAGPVCATTASATAEAWDFGQQVEGQINGGGATQLSHFQYPLGIPDENAVGNAPQTGFLAWAPDAKHLAVAIMQDVPFSTEYNPYIVDTATHAPTRVPLSGAITVPSEGTGRRILSWADTHTLILVQATNGPTGGAALSYDITSGNLTPLPGITGAVEGVVRCGTLFYSSYGAFTPVPGAPATQTPTKAPVLLHRYSLTAHAEAGNPIPLGDASTYPGAEGQIAGLGWDVSHDGSKIAYQQTKVTYSGGNLVTTSTFWAANDDGTGAVRILTQATANSPAFLAIAPNGRQVAVTAANPTPNVLSGSMGGGSALSYTPDSDGAPAWLADSSGFDAQLQGGQGVSAGLYRYLLTAPINGQGRAQATEVQLGGSNPATLP